jgi:REP element-mobilizing transposase RayT
MPQSLAKILVHIVFSTKNRIDLIMPEAENGLYRYISGIVKGNGARLMIANGTMSHSHFLFRPDQPVRAGWRYEARLIKLGKKERNSKSLLATGLWCLLDRPVPGA